MFFKKKEDETNLPDLPPLPGFSGAKTNTGQSSLPPFPDLPPGNFENTEEKKFGEMIEPPEKKETFLHPAISSRPEQIEAKVRVMEMEEWHPSAPPARESGPEFPERPEAEEEEPETPIYAAAPSRSVRIKSQESNPAEVFVRIDKFHSARKSLSEIGERLEDIDDLVKKIRETKLREEQELAAWEKDLEHIKSRVQTVSENIFEKVD
jgi:hypothetical protein